MGGAAGPELAAAVSNAGGLGTLPLSWSSPAEVTEAVEQTQALTQKPFATNFLFNNPQDERVDAALAAGAPVISLGWGDPAALIPRIREGGARVLVTVGTAAEARHAADAGADAIVAQGWEAGGHVWGTVATLALVPAVEDAVAPVPVVAAGGISDGRGVAAVLALGAAGAWVGTRFLVAEESAAHPAYRERLFAATEEDTFYGLLFDGGWPDAPHRALRNSTVDEWERGGRPEPGERPGEGERVATRAKGGAIARYASSTPAEGMEGDIEAMSMWAGQGVRLVTRTQPAAEIVAELVAEAERVLAALP
jgi:NAD(P)H-dependent flavin oxidoreductase YrpB (nitropropane dioxygenase family)